MNGQSFGKITSESDAYIGSKSRIEVKFTGAVQFKTEAVDFI